MICLGFVSNNLERKGMLKYGGNQMGHKLIIVGTIRFYLGVGYTTLFFAYV